MTKHDIQNKLNELLRGRNGYDELAAGVSWVAVLLLVIDLFARQAWLSVLVLAILTYALFRMLSPNVAARRKENEGFLELMGPARPWLRNPRAALAEAREYKHVLCPNCHKRLRVPRGKGKIRVSCPQCHQKFETKS